MNRPNPNSYKAIADRNRSKANSNNLYYRQLTDTYDALSNAASKIDISKSTFSGVQAAVAMDNAKIGSTITISGTGTRDGVYTLTHVPATRTINGGDVWVSTDGKSNFVNGAANNLSILSQTQGGSVNENKKVKVKFRK